MVRDRKCITESTRGRGIAKLAAVFALAFAVAIALPVSLDSGFPVNGAFAAGNSGNAGGKGKALGLAGASAGMDADAGDGEIAGETPLVPVDANNQVVQELAGLPDNSALSEEEELEAIRSGWGTWRTADGPGTVTAQ